MDLCLVTKRQDQSLRKQVTTELIQAKDEENPSQGEGSGSGENGTYSELFNKWKCRVGEHLV